MTPATLLSSARCCRVAWPMELATAPRTMKTRLNPMINIIEFSITERMSLDLIADIFNIANKYNVADVNPLFTSAGQATAAYDPRQFQFALKLNW